LSLAGACGGVVWLARTRRLACEGLASEGVMAWSEAVGRLDGVGQAAPDPLQVDTWT
jgi:hypothetical protein